MATILPQERYYTSLQNSMDAISDNLNDELGLQLRRPAGGQYTQTEFQMQCTDSNLERDHGDKGDGAGKEIAARATQLPVSTGFFACRPCAVMGPWPAFTTPAAANHLGSAPG